MFKTLGTAQASEHWLPACKLQLRVRDQYPQRSQGRVDQPVISAFSTTFRKFQLFGHQKLGSEGSHYDHLPVIFNKGSVEPEEEWAVIIAFWQILNTKTLLKDSIRQEDSFFAEQEYPPILSSLVYKATVPESVRLKSPILHPDH